MPSSDRNRILVRLIVEEEHDDDSATIDLSRILSNYSPPGADATSLPNIPLNFSKDALFEFILRALAKQFQAGGIHFYVLKRLSDFDQIICRYGPRHHEDIPLPYKLVLQLLVHWSKIASDEWYNVSKQLEKDIEMVCLEMSLPLRQLPEFVPSSDERRGRILSFLTRPAIVGLLCGELKRYQFTDLSAVKVKKLLSEDMIIYETGQSRWSMYGWTVIDGIVLMGASLLSERPNHRAHTYTLSLHESIHYLARRFSNNFGFSSPGKDQQFMDPDSKLAEKGRGLGLELGRSAELQLLGMQVNWSETPSEVAKEFVDQVENDQYSGPYILDKRDQLIAEQCPCSYSGMCINLSTYFQPKRF